MLKGERMDRALEGESLTGDQAGDGGMRRWRSAPVAGAEWRASQLHEHPLDSLDALNALNGFDVGDDLPDLSPAVGLPTDWLASALRKSVYAVGGVIGVGTPSSCLTGSTAEPSAGLRGSSDGKLAEAGVWRGWSFGLMEGMMARAARPRTGVASRPASGERRAASTRRKLKAGSQRQPESSLL